jgi:Baseplate J-like protein
MTAPKPDLKPHVPPPPPGSERCGCCDGISAETPLGISNRDGLSAIAYRVGDYARFRASLQALLSDSRFPQLARLLTRDPDDFTIGLIDAFACAADVLTFYQERLANESYLRTAVERVSLQELGRLIGYRLRPGVAAETWLAFTLETPPEPPPGLPPEPGAFVTGVPASLSLEAGLQVKSVPGPGERPQTFETVEPLAEARPAWNAIRPWMSEVSGPGSGATTLYAEGLRNDLKKGDPLVVLGDAYLSGTDASAWDLRLIESVEPDAEANRTLVRWGGGLDAVAAFTDPATQHPEVHLLRRRAAVFGHNAPMWGSMIWEFRYSYPDGHDSNGELAPEWPHFILSPLGATAHGGYVDLDAVYSEVANGAYAVLAKGAFNHGSGSPPAGTWVELYAVSTPAEVSRAEFALSGKVTRLRLTGANYAAQFQNQVRETTALIQSERLTLAEYPVTTPVGGALIPAALPAEGLLPGRRLIVRGTRVGDGGAVAVPVTLVEAHPVDATRCLLEIDPPLAEPLAREGLVVHANCALASHGESVAQVLGSGDASRPFQRFELKQLPLTYRSADNEIGAAAELTVRVGAIAWHERPTLYGAIPTDRAYTLTTDEQGRLFVVFGDGMRGARLPSGGNNLRATYRKGTGAEGNCPADALTQLMSRPLGLKGVANPIAAAGGTDPEAPDAARESIPLVTRTLGRAVSVLDYEDFARAFTGVAKARAAVLDLPGGRTVAITIAGPDGAALTSASPVWGHLLDALRSSGDPLVPVLLLTCRQSTFRLGIRVKGDPDYGIATVLDAVETALRDAFSFDRRGLGQPVQGSEVIAVAQAVPGVVAVDLTRLYGGTSPFIQTLPLNWVRLLANRMGVLGGTARPAEILTLDPAPFDLLEEMS